MTRKDRSLCHTVNLIAPTESHAVPPKQPTPCTQRPNHRRKAANNTLVFGLDKANKTNKLVAFLKKAGGLSCLNYEYVTYELNPRRTSGRAIFDNGLPAASSGLGGIDILLRSNNRAPVVGEIKIKDDADPFFAIIQTLTYAIEAATWNQLKRLRTNGVHGNDCFSEYDGQHVDICIILLNHTKERMIEKSLELGKGVVSKLSFIGEFNIVKNEGNEFVVCR